jgi:hypothetical protein
VWKGLSQTCTIFLSAEFASIFCQQVNAHSDLWIRDVLSQIWICPFSHPGSGSKHFFIPVPGSYMKSGMQTYFFLAFYAFRSKVLVLVIPVVKKIRDPEKIHPGSGSRNQGVKKPRILDPDPQYCSPMWARSLICLGYGRKTGVLLSSRATRCSLLSNLSL